jgi:hypothetical protein
MRSNSTSRSAACASRLEAPKASDSPHSPLYRNLRHFTESSAREGPFGNVLSAATAAVAGGSGPRDFPAQSVKRRLKISCARLESGDCRAWHVLENYVSSLLQFASQVRNARRQTWTPGSPMQALMLRILLILTLTVLHQTQLLGAVHPVPLEPNTDAKKCLECHQGLNEEAAVEDGETALGMGAVQRSGADWAGGESATESGRRLVSSVIKSCPAADFPIDRA